MVNVSVRDILSLTEFQRNAKNCINRVKDSKSPLVVTVNGAAEVVIQDADSFQEMVDRLRALEDLAAIREGIAQADAGKTRPALEALTELRQRHEI